ncbi:MAG: hypothetical protein LBU97_05280 [Alistipes sp.]|jgi:hypothetical protein|nr:hypothetical protein [Alistipes sp.]
MNFPIPIRKALPYLVAIVVFWCVSALYFSPQFSGDTLSMSDVTMYGGMKADISDHRAAFDEDPQWTGGMFGGMPAYLITVKYPAMILRNAVQWCMNLLGEPMALMFLAMLGFWLMLLMCGVNPWLAIPFALAYGLSTYNILIIEAGHITKMRAMGYAPMLVGAVWWTLRRGTWLGGGLAALFGTLMIAASHHQITYYFLLVAAALWIGELVWTARHKEGWRRFCVSTAVLVAAAVLAAGANFTHLWYTLEHTPDTTRGGSEVVAATAGESKSGGLDLDYATAWSYGIGESLNMFIPNARGGASYGGLSPDGEVAEVLQGMGYSPRDAADVATQLPGYWGAQPFTGGPTYIGAVMVFLFVLGLFVLPARQRWWILGVSVVALLLAWGRNAMWFTELSFWALPGYNKFRTVSMALAVLQWSVPFVAALVASELWKGTFAARAEKARFMRGLAWAAGLAGGTALLLALVGGAFFGFAAAGDSQFEGIPGLVDAVRGERAALLRADSWRSLMFVLLTAALAWWWVSARDSQTARDKKTLKRNLIAAGVLAALVLVDLVPVDVRFLSHDDFQTPTEAQVIPDEADLQIMADTEPGFRVMSTDNPFNEAYTSYFHRSVGGYHAAKLSRYQDIIDRYLSRFHLGVLAMLNTKYFIDSDPATGERRAELNPDAFGAAWFVDGVAWVDGAAAELDALETADLRHEAIVDQRFREAMIAASSGQTTNTDPSADTTQTASIRLVEYRANYLRYETSAPTDRVAVFSEIYYDKGWRAYIDGVEAPYLRADYILRAMIVPEGTHTVEWRFRAPRFALVEGITLACSLAVLAWLAAGVALQHRQRNANAKKTENDGSGR